MLFALTSGQEIMGCIGLVIFVVIIIGGAAARAAISRRS
jgi:hypothetical protein